MASIPVSKIVDEGSNPSRSATLSINDIGFVHFSPMYKNERHAGMV